MNQEPRIDILAAALADRARSRMVAALMDGCAYSAKELAFRAEVTPQTASFHLRRLTESGVLEGYRRGRHHYFHIGDPDIAAAVEALMAAAPQAHLRNLPPRAKGDFVLARSCWTHLAGKLAVALAARLTEMDALAFRGGTFVPGPQAPALLSRLGLPPGPEAIAPATAPSRAQPWTKPCLDWTERRFHLAGTLGRSLLERFLAQGWLTRSGEGRALLPTATGAAAFHGILGIDLEDLRDAVAQEREAAE
ncbi:MAG: winged helix-turn-helix domain-containing protein [Sneathiellaceae bacterium]